MEEQEVNPLLDDLGGGRPAQPCTLVIFGGTGDLARRKLLPGLYNLHLDGLLPSNFAVVGSGRRQHAHEQYRAFARKGVEEFSRRPLREDLWREFEKALFFVPGELDKEEGYARLKSRLEEIESGRGLHGGRIFYLSIPPSLFEAAVGHLRSSGLVGRDGDGEDGTFSRIIVEKPIGYDLESAREINGVLSGAFDENQIFRIDHYLGKETVQNILVMRFANSIFEPIWNQKYIDHVQITVAEEEGVGTRAGYYEGAGALRDMVQNHILQLFSLTAMEPPWVMDADVVRNQKLEVLNCLRPIRGEDVRANVVRAQYGTGFHGGEEVPGYRREEGVKPDSTTETYVALKLFVDNWRWAGVPFYLRTGKRMARRASEIAIQFKDVPPILFNARPEAPLEPNVLALRVQPDEGLSLRIASKVPGARVRIYPVKMDFRYGSTFGEQSPEAYERLLLDVMAGDATHFMRRDAVEASWAWVTEILEAWEEGGGRYLPEYEAGSWGPVEADRLIEADGRRWRRL
jgi:glucose-6-phosphate 1-dehydrogenase